ncbi:MAG: S41 family peptidase [Thalassotalea sp.]|nr:S41 family peptidase [Thalassotalea sp.]
MQQGPNNKKLELAATYEAINLAKQAPVLSYKNIEKVGYIRFNNSLGNSETVTAFKEAIENLVDTQALIVDLRNIPSGGNTSVAEPILGHFVKQKTAYQLYQLQENGVMFQEAQMQQAFAKPNTPFYSKPFVILVGRWTGSIGEGMMIGFDALGARAIIGAPVADLLGGIKSINLDESNSTLYLGFERLFHVNGTYREDFEANIAVIPADWGVHNTDPALNKALEIIHKDSKQ